MLKINKLAAANKSHGQCIMNAIFCKIILLPNTFAIDTAVRQHGA